jgi:hypothetical protein
MQRNWAHKTNGNNTKTQHNMCWTLLHATNTNNVNKTLNPHTNNIYEISTLDYFPRVITLN